MNKVERSTCRPSPPMLPDGHLDRFEEVTGVQINSDSPRALKKLLLPGRRDKPVRPAARAGVLPFVNGGDVHAEEIGDGLGSTTFVDNVFSDSAHCAILRKAQRLVKSGPCEFRQYPPLRDSQYVLPMQDYIKWAKAALKQSGKSQAGLARLLGRDPAQITRMLKPDSVTGKPRRLQIEEVRAIAEYTGVPSPLSPDAMPKANASKAIELVDSPLTATLPRYRSAYAGQGGAVLMDSLHDNINAPRTLAGIEGAFACFVHGDSMEPFLFAGDTVFCHPYVPPRGNDFVVIQAWENDQHGHLLGLVKQFVKQDTETVTVRQFNPSQEFTLPRERVKQVNKIVHIEKP